MKMSLNITNIKIENAKAGSDKMVAVGILGRFTVDFYLDDGTHFLSLKDMTLRQTKDGKKYIQHAYETWGPENKKKYFHYLWPGMDNHNRDAKMNDLVQKVSEQIDSADPSPTSTAPAVPNNSSSSLF
jgi:hypothetical protein|tara:strand:- start:3378 stop:3761 length:384 start_codon:yes stop_codon:yes gene_type:complete